jgi:hypothetical protein
VRLTICQRSQVFLGRCCDPEALNTSTECYKTHPRVSTQPGGLHAFMLQKYQGNNYIGGSILSELLDIR